MPLLARASVVLARRYAAFLYRSSTRLFCNARFLARFARYAAFYIARYAAFYIARYAALCRFLAPRSLLVLGPLAIAFGLVIRPLGGCVQACLPRAS